MNVCWKCNSEEQILVLPPMPSGYPAGTHTVYRVTCSNPNCERHFDEQKYLDRVKAKKAEVCAQNLADLAKLHRADLARALMGETKRAAETKEPKNAG